MGGESREIRAEQPEGRHLGARIDAGAESGETADGDQAHRVIGALAGLGQSGPLQGEGGGDGPSRGRLIGEPAELLQFLSAARRPYPSLRR